MPIKRKKTLQRGYRNTTHSLFCFQKEKNTGEKGVGIGTMHASFFFLKAFFPAGKRTAVVAHYSYTTSPTLRYGVA